MTKKTSASDEPDIPAHKRGGDAGFGEEGTNKTIPTPQPDAEPSGELQGTKSKYIPNTPYTRG
jgi:hypothetical protein